MLAIRIRDLGCYFGPRLETDGVERPREAWRSLRLIAGLPAREPSGDVQLTVAVTGHVLRDLSLDIEAGSVIGLAGPSGSGKSVLLQMLAGIVPPTAGRIELFAPVRALVTLGDNVDEQHSADENIRSSPAFLDAPAAEAEQFALDVIEFAGLHGFEHVPLRTYSTGMQMRLSVAMALCGRPSIVLIDDVLAVGDIEFQQRCIDRVDELKAQGCTLVLAFSDDALMRRLATRVVTLGGGRIVSDTTPVLWVTTSQASSAADVAWEISSSLPEDEVMIMQSLSIAAGGLDDDRHLDVRAVVMARTGGVRCRPFIEVLRGSAVIFRSLFPRFLDIAGAGPLTFSVKIPIHLLSEGTFTLGIGIVTIQGSSVFSMKAGSAVALTVRRGGAAAVDSGPPEALSVPMAWDIERVAEAAAS